MVRILDSMLVETLPSRAEISDIHNLLLQGASGLVLAAETAIGANPVTSTQVVNYMFHLHTLLERNLTNICFEDDMLAQMPEHLRAWL